MALFTTFVILQNKNSSYTLCIVTSKARYGHYGVAADSRIAKITSLFYKRALSKRQYSAKESSNFVDPTDRSHPISASDHIQSADLLFIAATLATIRSRQSILQSVTFKVAIICFGWGHLRVYIYIYTYIYLYICMYSA